MYGSVSLSENISFLLSEIRLSIIDYKYAYYQNYVISNHISSLLFINSTHHSVHKQNLLKSLSPY